MARTLRNSVAFTTLVTWLQLLERVYRLALFTQKYTLLSAMVFRLDGYLLQLTWGPSAGRIRCVTCMDRCYPCPVLQGSEKFHLP